MTCVLLLLSALACPRPAAANSPLPSIWELTGRKRGYRIDPDTITHISLLKCKEKVILDPHSRQNVVVPFVWTCEVEVEAQGVTYGDGELPAAKVKRDKIEDQQQ
jgi:hypothetical protein